jgi:hypothetical protein
MALRARVCLFCLASLTVLLWLGPSASSAQTPGADASAAPPTPMADAQLDAEATSANKLYADHQIADGA